MEKVADPTFVFCQVVNCKQKISRGKTGTERSRLSNTGMRTHLMTAHGKEWQEFLTKERKVQEADWMTGRKCWRQMRLKTEEFLFLT